SDPGRHRTDTLLSVDELAGKQTVECFANLLPVAMILIGLEAEQRNRLLSRQGGQGLERVRRTVGREYFTESIAGRDSVDSLCLRIAASIIPVVPQRWHVDVVDSGL